MCIDMYYLRAGIFIFSFSFYFWDNVRHMLCRQQMENFGRKKKMAANMRVGRAPRQKRAIT